MSASDDASSTRLGLCYGVGAFGLWGVFPLYFKLLTADPLQVLVHRVVWAALLLALIVTALGLWTDALRALSSRRVWAILGVSALLIAVNWFVFILAVTSGRVIETSLGYYMTPLANVALGFVFLRERLRPLQLAAIALAGLGVGMLATQAGQFPWIALSLAVSFSFYGLLRKIVGVDSLYGLLFETAVLTPAALGLIAWQWATAPDASALPTLAGFGMLALTGPITSGPLLLFAAAARRLKMATLGILQFLAPTIQFSIAVLVFREPFLPVHERSFACIWLAIVIYSLDALRSAARPRPVVDPPVEVECDGAVECSAGASRAV